MGAWGAGLAEGEAVLCCSYSRDLGQPQGSWDSPSELAQPGQEGQAPIPQQWPVIAISHQRGELLAEGGRWVLIPQFCRRIWSEDHRKSIKHECLASSASHMVTTWKAQGLISRQFLWLWNRGAWWLKKKAETRKHRMCAHVVVGVGKNTHRDLDIPFQPLHASLLHWKSAAQETNVVLMPNGLSHLEIERSISKLFDQSQVTNLGTLTFQRGKYFRKHELRWTL